MRITVREHLDGSMKGLLNLVANFLDEFKPYYDFRKHNYDFNVYAQYVDSPELKCCKWHMRTDAIKMITTAILWHYPNHLQTRREARFARHICATMQAKLHFYELQVTFSYPIYESSGQLQAPGAVWLLVSNDSWTDTEGPQDKDLDARPVVLDD